MVGVAKTERSRVPPAQLKISNHLAGILSRGLAAGLPAAQALDLQLLVEVRRQFLKEPARGKHHSPWARPGGDLGKAEVELIPGPRDGHVEKAPFLLDVSRLDRPPAGKLPVREPDQEDDVVFQALRLVHRR